MARTIFGLVKKSAVLAMLAGLAACQAADGTTQAPDVAMVNSLMKGLGAVDPHEKPIDYKPRAPLAMPSEAGKLPEPETNVAGTKDANWPQQKENEQLTELKKLYEGTDRMHSEPLSPEQMRGFRITGYTAQERDMEAERRLNEITEGSRLTKAEQKKEWEELQKLKAQQAGIDESGLTNRRYLTEPPTDYSTPSPDAPMPEVVSKAKQKPTNYDPYSAKKLDPRCLAGESQYCD